MNRNVLVIGANGGLGSVIARILLEQGDNVAATVSRPEKLDAFRRDLPECDPVIALDLSRPEEVKSALGILIGSMPKLDAVITCAAIAPAQPLEFMPLDLARETMTVNALAALAIYQASIDALRSSKGRLIFTSSANGKVSTVMQGVYSASKFALEALADSMRQECAEWGVDVVLLEPAGFRTPTVGKMIAALEHAINHAPEPERTLHGHRYRQMHHLVGAARDNPDLMMPETVARAAVEAVNAPQPETRYVIGSDAAFLIQAKREKSDREMDELILGSFDSAPV